MSQCRVLKFKTQYQPPTAKDISPAAAIMAGMLKEGIQEFVLELHRGNISKHEVESFFCNAMSQAVSMCYATIEVPVKAATKTHDTTVKAAVKVTTEGSKTFLSNSFCTIEYDSETKSFSGRDLKDSYNLPVFYSTTHRSHKKAIAALQSSFTVETTMYGAMDVLRCNGVKCHSYCSMD